MPPLDEDGLGAHIEELARGDVYVLFGVDLHVREQFRFGAVGRQEIGLGQNVPAQGIDRILAEEPLPALAYADGIDHKRELAPLQSGFDRFNDFGGEQHTGLGRGDGEAFPDRFELKPHKARFRGMDTRDAHAVLRGQGGNDAHPEPTDNSDGFEVGLNARAAAGVGTGDGEDTWRSRHGKRSFDGAIICRDPSRRETRGHHTFPHPGEQAPSGYCSGSGPSRT